VHFYSAILDDCTTVFWCSFALPFTQGSSTTSTLDENRVEQMIKELPESVKAKETRMMIARTIGAPAYYSWFHQARFETRDGEIQMIAPNSFVEQYWETQYPWVMKGRASC
jgi:hypothetical protein